jgi:RIO-like serine/threonine protein kinase
MTLDVAALTKRGELIGEARNATKANVWLVEDGGRALVVKSIAGRPAGARRFVASYLLRREGRVLARLRGTPGVPNLVEATDEALVVERIPGETLFALRKRGIDAETGRRIEALVASLHARGLAHGDIGRRDVLVAADGAVGILDFATAIGAGFPPVLGRLLLPIFKRRDAAQIAKLVRRYRARWDQRAAARAR